MTSSRTHTTLIVLCLLTLSAVLYSCNKDVIKNYPELPENPFDNVDYGDGILTTMPLDSSSLLGLHTYIFTPSCAQPGCHDGNFEPDFRTVQSTYNTLVYHDVVKNDEDESFSYRVVPGSRAQSWLWERVITDDAVLGRMPLYDTLTAHEVEQIGAWIDAGAKDIFENSADLPDAQPYVYGWNAFVNDTNGYRLDTVRADIISPMQLPDNSNIEFWFLAADINAEGYLDLSTGWQLDFNKMKISDHPYDFSSVPYIDLTVQPALAPFWGYPFFSEDTYDLPFYHKVTINTEDYIPGRTYFVRLYVQDEDHSQPTEFPRTGTPTYLVSMMSFVVTP